MNFIVMFTRFPIFLILASIITAYYLLLFVIETLALTLWSLFSTSTTRDQIRNSWIITYPNSAKYFLRVLEDLWLWVQLKHKPRYSIFNNIWVRIISMITTMFVYINIIYSAYHDIDNVAAHGYIFEVFYRMIGLVLNLPEITIWLILLLVFLYSSIWVRISFMLTTLSASLIVISLNGKFITQRWSLIETAYVTRLILDASPLVKFVMFLLFAACLYSVILMLINLRKLEQADWLITEFEAKPWQRSTSLSFNDVTFGIEFVLNSGFKEYLASKDKLDKKTTIENVKKVMSLTLKQETDRLESNLWALATIGSISPYVGLFGTVWGIMNSFQALSQIQDDLSLAMVAPGISEALVATAMGLLAAIPAVIAYNRSITVIDKLTTRYNVLIDDFANFLQRMD